MFSQIVGSAALMRRSQQQQQQQQRGGGRSGGSGGYTGGYPSGPGQENSPIGFQDTDMTDSMGSVGSSSMGSPDPSGNIGRSVGQPSAVSAHLLNSIMSQTNAYPGQGGP